ncbi:MAG: GNAT family N-acetyltransferase [Phycisphaerae bacterium]
MKTKKCKATSAKSTREMRSGATAAVRQPAPSPSDLTIRRATARDAVSLRFFFDSTLRRDYFVRRGQLEDLISDPYHEVFLAELDGILVGIAIKTRGTCLTNALIHPAYRGLRIGRALIEHADVTQVRAKIDMSTGDPRAFYRKLGFASGAKNGKGNIEVMERGR